ncbi:MAG: DUF2267 domain-containing protein [Reyranella sp.]|jgi:uncharacterized protein (DUF2267 family)|nr:DUF2267 domain-containing protein [Reyranella sp.]
MTVPQEYKRASEQFEKLLVDARDAAMLQTTNQSYTMVQAVLRTFRRRLDVKDALRFASVLPVGARALFVADWDVSEPKQAFADIASMTKEVQSLRPDHNLSPDSAIRDVAKALRQNVDGAALDRVLAELPPGAAAFWKLD